MKTVRQRRGGNFQGSRGNDRRAAIEFLLQAARDYWRAARGGKATTAEAASEVLKRSLKFVEAELPLHGGRPADEDERVAS